ncbi:MAG: 1-deoxy-D-xylulose-5-phosphate reductoisomerase [Chloroflexi bacterium]|nr:1-deoxy-D-xylulose-5-phosphate reductoisomerase [Chloroflexota bacterium]
MGNTAKRLVVLGSTGSVGTQTMDIVRTFPANFNVVGLAARRSLDLLRAQVEEFHPRFVSCDGTEDEKSFIALNGCEDRSLLEMVTEPTVDTVVTATVGDVAIPATFAAINAGKDIALANKETVVICGQLVTEAARKQGVALLPLDSEPNAIWQCLRGEEHKVSRLIITASGGALRNTPLDKLPDVTPRQALEHPTWKMGPKITIDSATMMNKAFEVIEAHWLFQVPWDDIEIVIHPQSIIHSMVEFVDGSVKAQISPPDMHLPIQYALFYPDRVYNESIRQFDAVATGTLSFEPYEAERYPCFDMAVEFARREGTWPAALCGANDKAVDLFLSGKIGFLEIPTLIREALNEHQSIETPLLDETISAASWAREKVSKIVEG